MIECGNADMRDRLPELLQDGAAAGDQLAPVRDHVAGCAPCRHELELLRRVREAVRESRVPEPDTARIAASLAPYAPPARGRSVTASRAFRLAAGIVLVVGVGTLISTRREGALPDTATMAPSLPAGAVAPAAAVPSELPVGTSLGDLSEAELQDLLGELGELDAVTPAESDVVVVPAFDRSGA